MGLIDAAFGPGQKALFQRTWAVTIGPSSATTGTVTLGGLTLSAGQGATYTQLRTQFDIDKLGLGTAAKAKISLFNLSTESRQKIQKGWNVKLQAGYGGVNATIFLGVVGPNGAFSKRDGADIITTLECGDGESALVLGTLDRSYPAGTPLALILQDVISASGLDFGTVIGIPLKVFNKGFTAHGSITDTLNNLTKTSGLAWSVNNGGINVIPIKGFNGQSAELVSQRTGLIGTPSMDNNVLKFQSLLNPRIIPGGLVQLVSENTDLDGIYKVNRTHLEGDTHDSKWGQSCEAIQLAKSSALSPTALGGKVSTAVIG